MKVICISLEPDSRLVPLRLTFWHRLQCPSRSPRATGAGNLAQQLTELCMALNSCDFRVMRLALYQPDIAQNTGTILRLSACMGVPVDVIGPTGFDMTDRALRRAALDYLDHVDLTRHESFDSFLRARGATKGRLVALTAHAQTAFTTFAFDPGDTLLLGRESAGLPQPVHDCADARLRVPMRPGLRSLNIAVAAALVLGEALRQTGLFPE